MSHPEVIAALDLIASGQVALKAVVESELEDLDLITTSDAAYAKLTAEGRAVLSAG